MNKKFLFAVLVLLSIGAIAIYKLDLLTLFSRPKTLTVMGYAFIQQENRIATFSVSVRAASPNKEKAVSLARDKAQTVVSKIKEFGIDDKDIKTQNMNVYRDSWSYWEDNVQKFKEGDWNADISIEIRLRDLSKVQDLADALGNLDISNMWGPNFSLDSQAQEEIRTQLTDKAFDNAKERAQRLASKMGLKLGDVLNVVEGYSTSGINYPMMSDYGGAGGAGNYLQPGSSELSLVLTVTFELKK